MKKLGITSLILGAMMTMGVAQAEPMKLTTQQMDKVSAGTAFAAAASAAAAAGINNATTTTTTQTAALQALFAQSASQATSTSFAN